MSSSRHVRSEWIQRVPLQERRALGLFAGCASLWALSGCGRSAQGAEGAADHPLLGAAAPELDVPGVDGRRRLTSAAQVGKVWLVDFWATWCEPCRQSFPAYQALADELGSGFAILALSVDDEPSGIRAFVEETRVKFAVGWDEGQLVARAYQPPSMPTSFLVDSSGIVRFVHAGYHPGDEQRLREEIRSLS